MSCVSAIAEALLADIKVMKAEREDELQLGGEKHFAA
jgi:hypothetical protein